MAYDTIGNWWPENPDTQTDEIRDDPRDSYGEDRDFSRDPIQQDPSDYFLDDDGGDEIPAVAPDYRQTYTNPDPTAKKVSVDSSGNPIWQLIDAGGDIIQWGINAAGEAFGITNLGSASGATKLPPVTVAPATNSPGTSTPPGTVTPPGGAGTLPPASTVGNGFNLTGNKTIDDLLSNMLTGNNSGGTPGISIAPQTVNYAPTTFSSDSRSNVSTTTVVNQNSPDVLNSVLASIKSLFSDAPKTPAAPVTPSNDAVLGRANYPGGYASAGGGMDMKRSQPGSVDSTIATVKGTLPQAMTAVTPQNWLIVGGAVLLAVVVVLIFRRR